MTVEEIRKAIGEALAGGNDAEVDRLAIELGKAKVEGHKAELVKATAEAEALAGDREALALTIRDMLNKDTGIKASLEKVKAYGFTYSIDHSFTDAQGVKTKVIGGCALRVPEVKRARGTGGGGGVARGSGEYAKTTADYGLTPQQAFDKFATEDDKANLAKAVGGSQQWRVKENVRQRAIKEGLLQPVK